MDDGINDSGMIEDLDISKIMAILPHRYPMLLVDKVLSVIPSKDIRAYKNITINESVFLGHFPADPIYPGVLVVEGMAQTGGILSFVSSYGLDYGRATEKAIYFTGIDGAKFRAPVRPGDKLVYEVSLIKSRLGIWSFDCKAFVDSTLACEATLKVMIADKSG